MSKSSSLLKINVRGLTDEGIAFEGDVTAGDLDIQDEERLSVATPFHVTLHAGTVRGGVLCQGTVSGALRCRCDRCLGYYTAALNDIPICHHYENPEEDVIDLTADVREDILLAFPEWTVCQDDCRGLCANCGQNLNVRACDCHQEATGESPWGALDRLKLPGSGQE